MKLESSILLIVFAVECNLQYVLVKNNINSKTDVKSSIKKTNAQIPINSKTTLKDNLNHSIHHNQSENINSNISQSNIKVTYKNKANINILTRNGTQLTTNNEILVEKHEINKKHFQEKQLEKKIIKEQSIKSNNTEKITDVIKSYSNVEKMAADLKVVNQFVENRSAREKQDDKESARKLNDFEIIDILKYCIFTDPKQKEPLVELTITSFSDCLHIMLEFYRIFGIL